MNKNKIQICILISWTVVLLWMLFIFNLSSQVAAESNSLSTGITEVIIETVKKVAPKADFDIKSFNLIIRKNAHFFAYLALGLLAMNALRRSGVKGLKTVTLALGICVLYAVSDEVHQLFVPGRGGQARDVLIDSAGAGVGIGVYWVLGRIRRRVKWKTLHSYHHEHPSCYPEQSKES